jgi:hypothetical protein
MSMVIYRSVRLNREMLYGDPLKPQQILHEDRASRDAILFGLAVEDIGSLTWDGRNQQRSKLKIDTIITEQNGGITNAVLDRFQGELDTIPAFDTPLPAHVRGGVGGDITAFVPRIPGDLLGGIEANFDLNDAIGHEGTRLSIGGDWIPLKWLSVRSGLQIGGRVGAALSLGLGARPFPWLSIDAATSDIVGVFNGDRQTIDLALQIAGHLKF